MIAGLRVIPLRLVAVALGLVLAWSLALPALLALDPLAAATARRVGATAAGVVGVLSLVLARLRLRPGLQAAFSHRVALDLSMLSTAAALLGWVYCRHGERLYAPEALTLLWLQVASGQAAALVQLALLRPVVRALGFGPGGPLPSAQGLFALSAGALAVSAAGLLGAGSAGRAAGLRERAEAQRVAALADLLAAAVPLAPDAQSRQTLVELLSSDAHVRAELRPVDWQPAGRALEVRPGHRIVQTPEGRWHYHHRPLGVEALWVHTQAGVEPPVLAPDDLAGMVLLALLLLGVPLAGLVVGRRLGADLAEVARGLEGMGPGLSGQVPGVPVRGDDELGDLARAVNRLCLRAEAHSRRLAEEAAAAEQAEQARNRFLAVASQALRVPLGRIDDHFRALGRAGPLTPAQEEDVAAIAGATRQLGGHVEEILALSSLEAGHEVTLHPTRLAVGALAREVVLASRVNAAAGVTLALSVDPDCPEIEADGTRIRQVLENLVGNALKFTRQGFVQVGVGPSWGGGVHVQVADSGPGIPPEDLDRIFTEFHRVEAHRQVPGTGLGLAISRRLIERHGGQLWAESVVGEGSVFHLRLPARIPEVGP